MPTRTSKTEKRLLGTWRSDRRRTLKEWLWSPKTNASQRKRFAQLFGHLILRYTRQRVYIEFKGHNESRSYKVIGRDSESVAVMSYVAWMEEDRICHIHFEGDRYYWITIGSQREWFRKVTAS